MVRDGMSPCELERLQHLVRSNCPKRVLEIGMANGTSSVAMVTTMQEYGGHLTSIDPNQTKALPKGYGSKGVDAVRGLTDRHTLIEMMDFEALPMLVEKGEQFDCILVDGFHSFDLTFLDIFYADKLLLPGGLLLCHDSSSVAVYKALRWLERNKPYIRLSPTLWSASLPWLTRVWRKVFRRKENAERIAHWQMLAAYRKVRDHAMKEHELVQF